MHRRSLVSALAAGLLPAGVRAQAAWPSKPIKLIVGFTPGGGIDFTARTLQNGLEAALGQGEAWARAGKALAIGINVAAEQLRQVDRQGAAAGAFALEHALATDLHACEVIVRAD